MKDTKHCGGCQSNIYNLNNMQLTPGECLAVLAICCAFSFGIGVITEMLRVMP